MIIKIRKTADKPHGSMQFFFFLNMETKQTYKTYIFRVRLLVSKESIYYKIYSVLNSMFSLVQLLSCVQFFVTPWTAAHQTSSSITNSQSLLKLMSIESVMQSNHSSVVPFSSCLQSFPASVSFLMSQFFESSAQSIGASASASVLPKNIQD